MIVVFVPPLFNLKRGLIFFSSHSFLNSFLKSKHGFTLIEVLVVIAIAATMMGLAVSLFGGTYHTMVKREVSHFAGSARFVYNDAIQHHLFERMVVDLDDQSYWVETSEKPFYVQNAEQIEAESKSKKNLFKNSNKKHLETSGLTKADAPTTADAGAVDGEEPVSNFSLSDNEVVKKVKLNKGVKIRDVVLSRLKEPVTEGQIEIYFFPTGLTEQVLVHFSNSNNEEPWHVMINPLTAHATIGSGEIDVQKFIEQGDDASNE